MMYDINCISESMVSGVIFMERRVTAGSWATYSDNRLIELVHKGNGDAFDVLAGRYLPVIRAKAAVYGGAKTEFDDFIQEGFLAFLHAVKSFDENAGASFSTYAGICIERRFFSVYKSEKRQKNIPADRIVPLHDGSLTETPENGASPEQELIDKEAYHQMMAHIKKRLTPFEQKVLSFYLSGLTYAQTADALKTTAKSVDNALQRIRKKLRGVS